jgi:LGFP repeat
MPQSRIRISPQDRVTVTHSSHQLGEQMGEIPPVISQALLKAAKRRNAEQEIKSTWTSLGGAPGRETGDLMEIGVGFYRQYEGNSRIYFRPGHRAINVYGGIGDKYTQLGGPDSWLGWPTPSGEPPALSEQPFDQGGRVSTFQHGAIYWWPDTGAIELGDIAVRYTGLACFSETDSDQLSDSDEPYVIFGVIPMVPLPPSAPRTRIYEDVDSGESREDNIELYRGLPYGLSLSAVLMEHDFSDPDEYRAIVKQGVDKASSGVVAALNAIPPPYGPALAAVGKLILDEVGPILVELIHDAIDTKDDYIDTKTFVVTPKDMITLTRVERQNFRGILWHRDSPLLSGEGADYKVYIDIQAV